MIIFLPSGKRLVITSANDAVYGSASAVFSAVINGVTTTETLPTAANAASLVFQLDYLLQAADTGSILYLNGSQAVLQAAIPDTFDATTGFNLIGKNFSEMTLGFVYALSRADALSGTLTNSYKYTPTFLSSEVLQCAYLSTAGAPVPAVLVYVDANGVWSNPVPVTTGAAAGLTWVSITPNNVVGLDGDFYTIAGTGFLSLGAGLLLRFTGPGLIQGFTIYVDSDIQMRTGVIDLAPGGTWTLEYSTDSGASWTSTALTVVST